MGPFNARLQADGTLSVSIQGALMPVQYKLFPVSLEDSEAFEREKTGDYDDPDEEEDEEKEDEEEEDEKGEEDEDGDEEEGEDDE
jgi:hypothetical protein